MAVTYCTSDQVAAFFQINAYDANSTPTKTQVEEIINEAEDFIDQNTGHAFRTVAVTREYHDFPEHIADDYAWDGFPVYLHHREIRLDANQKLEPGQGDKLEVFDGENWIDWTATMTDGRGDDFWVEPDKGILWIRSRSYFPRKRSVRLTYRFGSAAVPNDIRRAAILLAAAQILSNEDYSNMLPEGTEGLPKTSRAENWRADAAKILEQRQEIILPSA